MTIFQEQAQLLRNAMKGSGTDQSLLINIASQYNWVEREQISKDFTSSFGLELSKELKKELSQNLKTLFIGLFQNRHEFWAQQIFNSIQGAGTNEKKLICLILLMSDADVEETSNYYEKLFNKELFKSVGTDISNNDWGRLLKGWLKGQHQAKIDPIQAADDIYKASRKQGTDEDVFLRILCNTSHECYGQIVHAFQQKYGKQITQLIKEEFAMRSEFAFLLAHEYLLNPLDAVQFVLKNATAGAGTDDSAIINITILFADYFKGKLTISDLIKNDLSGDYKKTVMKMWAIE